MYLGIFEILARISVREPGSKLVIFDPIMASEARRFVVEANREERRLANLEGPTNAPQRHPDFRAFLLGEAAPVDGVLTGHPDLDRPLTHDASRELWLLDPRRQGNLVNLRDGRIVVSFRPLDDGSNDENTFPVWLNRELPDDKRVRFSEVAEAVVKAHFPSLQNLEGDQHRQDAVHRVSSALRIVAEAHNDLGRTEWASTGTLWLRHLDAGLSAFQAALSDIEVVDSADALRVVRSLFFPSLGLPNPTIGDAYQSRRRTGSARSVAEAIEKYWCETDGENRILASIDAITESRLAENPPRIACRLSEIDWSRVRRTWVDQGLASDFLSWATHLEYLPNQEVGANRCELVFDLTEDEFFRPIHGSLIPIEGEWGDGRQIRYDDFMTDAVLVSPTRFDEGQRRLVSGEVVLRLALRPGPSPTEEMIRDVHLASTTSGSKKSPKFDATSKTLDEQAQQLVVRGVFSLEFPGRGAFSYRPETSVMRAQGSALKTGQEIKVLMLPSSGFGYLVGSNLQYQGPTRFDSTGAAIWNPDLFDPEDECPEFAISRKAGDTVDVLCWSDSAPEEIRIDEENRVCWNNRGFIRWFERIVARPLIHTVELRGGCE